MLKRGEMRGVYALPPTPFKPEDGSFDEEAQTHNIKALAEAGVAAVTTTGSNGEFHTITWPDHQRLMKALARDCKAAKIVSVCGASGVNTDEAIMKTSAAQAAGCDAVMNVSPYYVNITRRELVKFWHDLADACPKIGLVVYNNPMTAQMHDLAAYQGIVDIPTLAGSKEGHYDFGTWYSLRLSFPDYGWFTATEPDWVVPTLKLGERGFFSMAAAYIPRYMVLLHEACDKGQWDKAQKMVLRWKEMNRGLGQFDWGDQYTGIAKFKATTNAFGLLRCGINRRPFISVAQDTQARLSELAHKEFMDLIEP